MTLSSVKIEIYNPKRSVIFQDFKFVIEGELKKLLLSIEHVGSTSIIGLGAKPIIDLDLVIDNSDMLPEIIKKLGTLGCYHEGNPGVEGREAFGRKDAFVPWDGRNHIWMEHHLNVCCKISKELARHLAFRDYLRHHPDAVKEYEQLKRNLATTAKDRHAYTEGKRVCVNEILERQ